MMQEESLNEPTKFQELGEALRQRRELKGLEIEDIALRIKVSAKNLQAIEEGKPDGLPQPVFTRGFIRSYAQLLEMDREEVEALLTDAFPDVMVNNINAERTTDAREQSVGINSPVLPKKLFGLLGVLILLGAIGAGVWLYFGGLDKLTGNAPAWESRQTTQEPAAGPDAVLDGETRPAALAQADSAAQAPADPGPADNTLAAERAGQANQSGQAAPPAASQPTAEAPPLAGSSSGQSAQATAPAPPASQTANQAASGQTAVSSTVVRTSSNPPAGVHQVQISVVSGRSWIGIQADNTTSRNFELRTGSSYRLEFRQRATVTIGNAAGVQVTYNGQRVPFTAREGEVKILRFPPAG